MYSTKDGASCKSKMWRCFSRVAEGGLEYFERPEGISGVLKQNLFKIAFNGAMGNFWGAMMSIPEVNILKVA